MTIAKGVTRGVVAGMAVQKAGKRLVAVRFGEFDKMFSTLRGFLATAFIMGALADTATAGTFAVTPNIVAGIAATLPNAAAAPQGANIASCQSKVDPYPVVLVNGTFSVSRDDFGALAPDLANAGYCVFTFNYGGAKPGDLIQAIGPVAASAQQLAVLVAQVKASTGAAKVDLVGHSQGGMLAEYYVKILGGAPNVHALVGISPTTHGTTLDGITALAAVFPGANKLVGGACPACSDQEVGSTVIDALDAGPVAQTGVGYTIIETRNETVVTPVGSSFINEPGVKNEYVQQSCAFDTVDHADLTYDNVVIQLVKNALTPGKARAPSCFNAFPSAAQ